MNFKDIYETLSKVDLSKYLEKKNGLTYLSWANGWEVMMNHYPQATFKMLDTVKFDDGTVEVWTEVTIEDHSRSMWLPVMNYKNQAIANPSSRDVSDSRMRCLVKNLAMFGLGLYVYQGEDLPRQEEPQTAVNIMDSVDMLVKCNSVQELTNTFRRLTKGHGAKSQYYNQLKEVAAKKKGELVNAAA